MKYLLVIFCFLGIGLNAQRDSLLHFSYHSYSLDKTDTASLNLYRSIYSDFGINMNTPTYRFLSGYVKCDKDSCHFLFWGSAGCCEPSSEVFATRSHDSVFFSVKNISHCDAICGYFFVCNVGSKDLGTAKAFIREGISVTSFTNVNIRSTQPPQAQKLQPPVYRHEGEGLTCLDCKIYKNGKIAASGEFSHDTLVSGRQYIYQSDSIVQIRRFKSKFYQGDVPINTTAHDDSVQIKFGFSKHTFKSGEMITMTYSASNSVTVESNGVCDNEILAPHISYFKKTNGKFVPYRSYPKLDCGAGTIRISNKGVLSIKINEPGTYKIAFNTYNGKYWYSDEIIIR